MGRKRKRRGGEDAVVDELVLDMYQALYRGLDDIEDEEDRATLRRAALRRLRRGLDAELDDAPPDAMYR